MAEIASDPVGDTDENKDKVVNEPTSTPAADEGNPSADKGEEAKQESNETDKSPSESAASSSAPVVSSSKRSRPPFKYDPDKITLRFLFANRDGLTVTVECNPSDTVGDVKTALLSSWPEDLPNCSDGGRLRLICMGKGILMPDTRTLEDFQVPVFKTHPTPINVSVRPEASHSDAAKSGGDNKAARGGPSATSGAENEQASQGCGCVIL